MENILKQAEAQADARIRPFVLTMRYSGLRISDVTVLSVDSLVGDHLRLYTAKGRASFDLDSRLCGRSPALRGAQEPPIFLVKRAVESTCGGFCVEKTPSQCVRKGQDKECPQPSIP
jgi:hypothetical protein